MEVLEALRVVEDRAANEPSEAAWLIIAEAFAVARRAEALRRHRDEVAAQDPICS